MKINGKTVIHITLVTRNRMKMFAMREMYKYDAAIVRACENLGCRAIQFKVLSNHLHVVAGLNEEVCVKSLVKNIATHVAAAQGTGSQDMWRKSCFVLSVRACEMEELIDYVKNNRDE